jgi:hypothetical protein
MHVPQISDRVKEAPAVALRGLLAGVGQLLLITDKLRNKTAAPEDVPQARTPDAAETVTAEPEAKAAPEAAPAPAEAKAAPVEAGPAPAEAEATAATTAEAAEQPETPAKPAARKRDFNKTGNVRLLTKDDAEEPPAAAAPEAPEAPAEAPVPAGPAPLPNYDELSVASLRARLRNLTAEQVGELAAYEREHAARPEVITMFERRIAKLEAEG